jgi:hypothetical protein
MTSDLNGAQGGAKASRIVYETGGKSQDETRTLADWQKKLLPHGGHKQREDDQLSPSTARGI